MEEEMRFDKDDRTRRLNHSNFKKRENKLEVHQREVRAHERYIQSLKSKYGDKWEQYLENDGLAKKEDDFNWSEEEAKNGNNKKNYKSESKKSKEEKNKEYEEDFNRMSEKKNGRKKY